MHSQLSVLPNKNNFIFSLNIQKDEYMILKKLKFIRFLLTSADIVILPMIFNNKGMEISLRFIKYKTRGFLKKNLNFLKEVFAKIKGGICLRRK